MSPRPPVSKPLRDLLALLPAYYRAEDLKQGGALRDLLRVVASRLDAVEAEIARGYDDWFIETCSPERIQSIGQLVGQAPPVKPRGAKEIVAAARREVGNAVRGRTRKGTLRALEDLASEAGFSARAVELSRLVLFAQHTGHLSPERLLRGRTVDVRDALSLSRMGGPLDSIARTVSVRTLRFGTPEPALQGVALFVGLRRAQAEGTDTTGHIAPLGAGDYPRPHYDTPANDVAPSPADVRAGQWKVSGQRDGVLVIEDLTLSGVTLRVTQPLSRLEIRHSTLVPPRDKPSVEILAPVREIHVIRSVSGPIVLPATPIARVAGGARPARLHITDSVVDAKLAADAGSVDDADRDGISAIGAPVLPGGAASTPPRAANVVLRVRRSTILGECHVARLEYAKDTIFDGVVTVQRPKTGRVRTCHVPPGSVTPRRFGCSPEDGARPAYASLSRDDPMYVVLAWDCPDSIRRGAADGGEMGAYHDAWIHGRMSRLAARVTDFVPAGWDVVIVPVGSVAENDGREREETP